MNKITEHKVLNEKVSVWHPKDDEKGFVISLTSGGWLSGIYDSVESALKGAEMDLNSNQSFHKMRKEVNYYDKGNRLISIDDLLKIEGSHE